MFSKCLKTYSKCLQSLQVGTSLSGVKFQGSSDAEAIAVVLEGASGETESFVFFCRFGRLSPYPVQWITQLVLSMVRSRPYFRCRRAISSSCSYASRSAGAVMKCCAIRLTTLKLSLTSVVVT